MTAQEKKEVKRYDGNVCCNQEYCYCSPIYERSYGDLVMYDDYTALEALASKYKTALEKIVNETLYNANEPLKAVRNIDGIAKQALESGL